MRNKIEIELPKGYVYVGYRKGKKGEMYFNVADKHVVGLFDDSSIKLYIIEPLKKTHRILETNNGKRRRVEPGEYYSDGDDGIIKYWEHPKLSKGKYNVWQVVERPSSWGDTVNITGVKYADVNGTYKIKEK